VEPEHFLVLSNLLGSSPTESLEEIFEDALTVVRLPPLMTSGSRSPSEKNGLTSSALAVSPLQGSNSTNSHQSTTI